ncbi:MAG: Phosphopantetheine adenylyltransferase, partial [uncultured Acidimicrobiales bacterium]
AEGPHTRFVRPRDLRSPRRHRAHIQALRSRAGRRGGEPREGAAPVQPRRAPGHAGRGDRPSRQRRDRRVRGAAGGLRTRPWRRGHREGASGRLRLRLRAADGAGERAHVRDRHRVLPDRSRALVPVVEPGPRGRPFRRRRVGDGARPDRPATQGAVRPL